MNDLNHRDDVDINKLRELRNKLSDMSYKIQKRIDELILEKNDFNKYNHQYLIINDQGNDMYIYVTHISRLNRGCRFHGIIFEGDGEYFTMSTYRSIDHDIESSSTITIISKEEFYNKLNEYYSDMLDKFKIEEND